MNYFDIVEKIRETYEYGDARHIYEHVAIQVNIVGEGSGALYIEIAGRGVCVEPYDYHDRDGLITIDGDTVFDICEGRITYEEAKESGRLHYEGNYDKLLVLKSVIIKR